MQLTVNEEEKLAAIWLTRAEQESEDLPAALLAGCGPFWQRGYTVAVFRSGEGDLFPATRDLLLHNRTAEQTAPGEKGSSLQEGKEQV